MSILLKMFRKDEGFTLVELMVVVLIIGILVAIAVPVFLNASSNAKLKSCQANQRTIEGAIQTLNANAPTGGAQITVAGLVAGAAVAGAPSSIIGSSIKTAPVCPGAGGGTYYVDGTQTVAGDTGTAAAGFITDGVAHVHY